MSHISSPRNVLVYPGGTEIGLEINRSLRMAKDILLFSAGYTKSSHASFVYRRHYDAPAVGDPGWLNRLNQIIHQCQIEFIFPAHDDCLVAVTENAGSLAARVVGSPARTCRITRSKSSTYRLLRGTIPVPKTYARIEDVDEYPVFVKPDSGQGSRGARLVNCPSDLASALSTGERHVIMEYLPGAEYTIDCFTDREAGLLFCQGRTRDRISSGISVDSSPVQDDVFRQYAEAISTKLELHGAWFFQLRRDEAGTCRLLEVGPRIAGTMGLHRALGVNFPLLSIYENERKPLSIRSNDVSLRVDRALVSRYRHNLKFSTAYVDLDDTLLFRGAVNVDLVRLLYQWVNQGIRIVLLTRHRGNLDATLKRHRIRELFDSIHCVGPSSAKSLFIREADAILIDDSFRERTEVSTSLGIPTFDCSMLEMLVDDREPEPVETPLECLDPPDILSIANKSDHEAYEMAPLRAAAQFGSMGPRKRVASACLKQAEA